MSAQKLTCVHGAANVAIALMRFNDNFMQFSAFWPEAYLLGVLPDFWLAGLSLPLVPASELLLFLSSVPLSGGCSEDLG